MCPKNHTRALIFSIDKIFIDMFCVPLATIEFLFLFSDFSFTEICRLLKKTKDTDHMDNHVTFCLTVMRLTKWCIFT